RADRDGPIGLSFAQQRLWFVAQLDGASQAYHMPAGLRLRGDLDEAALVRALDRIVYRHEVLRTRFVKAGDEPVQVIDPPGIGFALDKKDLSSTPQQDRDDQLQALAEAGASAPFDLAAGPLIRGTLVRLGEQDHALLVTMHHIISDGWSVGVLVSEFNQLYEAYCTDRPDPLPPLPIQYADYALWQRGQDLTPLIDYWARSLAGYTAPLDLSRGGLGNREPGTACLLHRPVARDLATGLHAFAADNNITLFMLLMTGLTLLAHRHTGRTDLAFGTTVAGRNRVELEPLIGFFINILPLRVTVEGHMSAAQLIEHVREVAIQGLNHADLPFEQLIGTVPELRNSSGHALLPVLIRHQNFPEEELGGWSSNLQAQPIAFEELRPAKCDLDIQYHGDASRLEALIEYDADRFSPQEVAAILDELEQLLMRLIRQPKASVDELTAISPTEAALLADWNKTARPFEATTIPELFARQVYASPEAVACLDNDTAYSFADLEARSNALARLLVTKGAKPEDRIALYLPRGVDFLAALLAVFKIGGIFVAIPPSYPPNYIGRILENADPSIIVTVPELAGELTPPAATVVLTAEESSQQQTVPLETPVAWQPDQIAYIAYTSGSTAEPTGIAVPHRQLLNCLQALWDHIPFADDEVIAQKTPAAFVVSLKEMLGALLAGIAQVIISDDESRDIDRLVQSLARHRVTRLNIVPSHLAALLEHRPDLPALRHIITAGEPLTQDLRISANTLFVDARIHNNYGCTELNDIAYSDPDEQSSRQGISPVGRPIANTRIHILDGQFKLLPIGAVGEILVEGVGVPAGYWRRPDLDNRRLIANPLDPMGPPLFRTGDLGRWRHDGQLDYCGRSDAQTKILGQRVDLLMVEATLKLHPDIAAGAVMTTRSEAGDTRIAAYYVPANGTPIDPNLLRSWFSTKLPNYMLPNLYKCLDALPLLPNGKLDRRALLSIPHDTDKAQDSTPPQTDVEKTIARIWSEILNIPLPTITRQDNFFALGGQSLLAVKMIARLNEAYQLNIPVKLVFAAGGLEAFAQMVEIMDAHSRGDEATIASVFNTLPTEWAELLLDSLGAASNEVETDNTRKADGP
ncbi:non-ribosomal peptide synthetase, partial [Rhizobium leguminosarum]